MDCWQHLSFSVQLRDWHSGTPCKLSSPRTVGKHTRTRQEKNNEKQLIQLWLSHTARYWLDALDSLKDRPSRAGEVCKSFESCAQRAQLCAVVANAHNPQPEANIGGVCREPISHPGHRARQLTPEDQRLQSHLACRREGNCKNKALMSTRRTV